MKYCRAGGGGGPHPPGGSARRRGGTVGGWRRSYAVGLTLFGIYAIVVAVSEADYVYTEAARYLSPFYSPVTKCCSEVCPEGIHITDNAIIPLKERVVDRRYDPLFKLARRIAARRRR